MATGKQPKTGNDLTQYLRQTCGDIRARTGIRPMEDIPVDNAGAVANRYYGKDLDSIGKMTLDLMTETEATGAYKGIGLTAKDYASAYTRMQDAASVDAALKPLAADAHADAVAARNSFADLTFKVLQVKRGMMTNPGTDPAVKSQFKDASGQVNEALAEVRKRRIKNRDSNAKARTTESALSSAQDTIQGFQEAQNVKDAQDDLKLKVLSGEPLRPEDLVMAPSVPAAATPAAGAGDGGKGGKTQPVKPSPAPKKTTGRKTKPR